MFNYLALFLLIQSILTYGCPFGFAGKNCKIECGKTNFNPRERIYGGSDAVPYSWPAHVLVTLIRSGSIFNCGGTLISPFTVLTAAQCVNVVGSNYTIIVNLGIQNISRLNNDSQVVKIKASKIIIHEKFNEESYENDIALIQLSERVIMNKNIQVACLPPNNGFKYPKNGESVWGVGFGQTNSTDSSNQVLKNAKFTVYQMTNCKNVFSFVNKDNAKQVCAGDLKGLKDLCIGDYGGGLYYTMANSLNRYVIGGVTSYGAGCGKVGEECLSLKHLFLPNRIFTRVSAYLDWIDSNIK